MPKEFLLIFVNVLSEILIWIILIRVVLSWFRPRMTNPIVRMIVAVSEPMLAVTRKLIPPTKMGLDFSPIIVFLAITILRELLITAISKWIL